MEVAWSVWQCRMLHQNHILANHLKYMSQLHEYISRSYNIAVIKSDDGFVKVKGKVGYNAPINIIKKTPYWLFGEICGQEESPICRHDLHKYSENLLTHFMLHLLYLYILTKTFKHIKDRLKENCSKWVQCLQFHENENKLFSFLVVSNIVVCKFYQT